MERRGGSAADEAGRAELERPGRPAARREADRARALLWSPQGETGPTIAARPARGRGAARTGVTTSPGHPSVVPRKGATAGAGRGTPSRGGRTRTRSTAPACA